MKSAFYRRYRRWFILLMLANAAFGIWNIWFCLTNLFRQDWLSLAVSAVCAAANIYIAHRSYKNWGEVQKEEKAYMWQVLGDESDDAQTFWGI